jgi:bifunctional pyridoxal-dependent enzyme with beta-cystathionase and maltose regulon repressor activities
MSDPLPRGLATVSHTLVHLMAPFELSVAELRARPGIKWHRYPDDVLPAWIAEMDFDVAEPIQAASRRLVDQRAYGYDDSDQPLAQAFADYMLQQFGWQPGADHVVPVADLVQAQFAAVTAFTERGQGVVLQTPIYPPFINARLRPMRGLKSFDCAKRLLPALVGLALGRSVLRH